MSTSTERPNILLIVTDQQRTDTINAWGNPMIRTPVLDRLCAEGTSFTRAYTPAPICSPARVAMATGRAPHSNRFTDHDWWHWEPAEGPPSSAPHDQSFMTRCAEAGYQTFFTGKAHFHGRGWLFDGVEECTTHEQHMPAGTRQLPSYATFRTEQGYPDYGFGDLGMSSEYYLEPQLTSMPPEHTHAHWLADQAIDFLQRRDAERPFLLQCHFQEPHPPICNPLPWGLLYRSGEMPAPHRPQNYQQYQSRTNRYQLRYKGKETAQEDDLGWRTLMASYYANISFLDWNIGRILDQLGPERDNTLIVFTSDHGELLGDYGCTGKRCMLEASIRVPMIAAWPGRIPADAVSRTPVSLMDIFPTVCEVLGEELPEHCAEGRSLIASANSAEDQDRIVFSQFSSGWCGQYAATDGQWTYAWSAPDRREWLFRIADELVQGPDRSGDADPEAQAASERLRGALLARHDPALDPWSDAVADGDWKLHDVPPETWHQDPTYGILCQQRNPQALQAAVDALGPGYARPVTGIDRGSLHTDHGVCGGVMPFG